MLPYIYIYMLKREVGKEQEPLKLYEMLLQSCSLVSLNSGYTLSPSSYTLQIHSLRFPNPKLQTCVRTRATQDQDSPLVIQDEQNKQPNQEVEESVRVLKDGARTRKVPAKEILAAFSAIERAKVDPSNFLQTLGGTQSPGRTWMLIFTAEKGLGGGRYFPITAIQRFDAAAKRIENGVYLGPLGFLTFEGPFSWKNRILAFVFERLRIKFGPFDPFDISIKGKDEREPSNKEDPFFVWFYIDEEIAVARGRSGGTAYWVRCRRVGYS